MAYFLFTALIFLLLMEHFFAGKKLYNSRFLTKHELARILPRIDYSWWYRIKWKILAWFGIKPKLKGFCIGADRQMSAKRSFRHLCVVGPTGSSKSQSIVIPNLLSGSGSYLVTDPKGELFEKTASWLQDKMGYEVQVFDLRPGATHSHSFNPFAGKTLPEIKAIIEQVYEANNMSATGTTEAGNFWKVSSVLLLYVLAWTIYLVDRENLNFANLRFLLQRFAINPKEVLKMVLSTRDTKLIQEFEAILKYDQKVLKNSITVATTLLDLFADERIAAITSQNTLDLERMRYVKTIAFIITPPADMKYYARLNTLIYMFGLDVAQRPPKNDGKPFLPLYFIFDEAANTGVILRGRFASLLAQVRSNMCGVMIILQSHSQLRNQVGAHESDEILANTVSEVILPAIDDPMARAYSQKMGITTERYTLVDDITIQQGTKPLMTPEQIQQLPDGMGLFFHGNMRPGLIRLTPAYRHPILKKRMKFRCVIPLPKIPEKVEYLEIPKGFTLNETSEPSAESQNDTSADGQDCTVIPNNALSGENSSPKTPS